MDWTTAMKSLKSEPISLVYTLVGDEPALLKRWFKALQLRLAERDGQEVPLERFDFESSGLSDALLACRTVSLFSDSHVVVLEDCSFLLASNKAKHDISELESYVENPFPERVLVLTLRADKADERKRIVKMLKKFPWIALGVAKVDAALEVVSQIAVDAKIPISQEAMSELWRRCDSVSLCETELIKLHTYTNGQMIELADVQELVAVPLEDNVFTWIDGVVKGNLGQTFTSLRDVQISGYDTFALLALLAKQLRAMGYAKVLGEKGATQAQIASRLGVHPYAVKVAADQARGVRTQQIERMLTILADAEFWVKSGRWEVNQALEYTVLACAGLNPKLTGKSTGGRRLGNHE